MNISKPSIGNNLLFECYFTTLNLILIPNINIGENFIEKIEYQLSEIEGNYYSYLNKENLAKLRSENYINEKIYLKSIRLYNLISDIEAPLWNPIYFIEHSKWRCARNYVIDIFIEIARSGYVQNGA